MALRLFNRNPREDVTGELCLEPEGIVLMRESETIEQKVTQIFQALRLPVYYYLMAFLDDAATADDLTQEVFLRLYAQLHRGRPVENVRLWVFRVAHNLAIDYLRQVRHLDHDVPEGWELREDRLDPGANAEQRLLEQEQRQRLRRAMIRLSPQERYCLELRAEGLSYREIAEVLGVSISSVNTFLGRGVKKLAGEINV